MDFVPALPTELSRHSVYAIIKPRRLKSLLSLRPHRMQQKSNSVTDCIENTVLRNDDAHRLPSSPVL